MKKFNFLTAVILGSILIFSASSFAQDENKSCCSDTTNCKMEKMDHSKMNHSMMQGDMKMGEMKAKKVDNSVKAWNAVCPVKGEAINPEANKVEYNRKVYGFCCNGCDSKFMKDPETYIKNLSEDGSKFIKPE